jgi:hypothetical protein
VSRLAGLVRSGRVLAGLVVFMGFIAIVAQSGEAASRPSLQRVRVSVGSEGALRTWSQAAVESKLRTASLSPHVRHATSVMANGVGPSRARWIHGETAKLAGTRYGLESTNWSGVIAAGPALEGDGSPITAVGSEWVVPTVAATAADEYSGTWIGLDGVVSNSLIQVGTLQNSGGGTTAYGAFYEVLPAAPVAIDEPVSAGDSIQALIALAVAPDTYEIVIQDSTQHWTWTSNPDITYDGPGETAEWIEEAPTVNGTQSTLADFGSIDFINPGLSSYNNPVSVGLNPVSMVNANGVVIAYPGEDSTGFTSTYGTPEPVIDSVSPAQGSTSGGTSVDIDGDYLTGATSVAFGGTPVPFSYNPDNSITATSPPGAAGTVDITVTTPGGTSALTGADQFTFVTPPPTPSQPPPVTKSAGSSGYDLVGRDGGVFVFPGSGSFFGSLPGMGVHVSNIVGMVPTADDGGYFLVGSDGGVFAFGNAPFLGSLPGQHVHINDVVGIVPTSDDQGYFLVGRDGGVFTFGNAPFLGSLPGRGIHVDDIIGIAADASGQGYVLIASTGQVYTFGNVPNIGSATGNSSPVSAIEATADGGGYWVVFQNGSVYTFGDAGFFGSLPGIHVSPARPVIGLVPTADGGGYWLIGADGGIFSFGDAPFVGSLPGLHVSVNDIVGAVATTV